MGMRNRRVLPESASEALAEHYDLQRHHVDVLCGGFPCQDISNAGKRAGISGSRSGLWLYMVRAIRVVRPKYVIVENVAALLGRGMGNVVGDLAESGYDSEWDCIPAAAVGADHIRDRIWIMAYPTGRGCSKIFDGNKCDLKFDKEKRPLSIMCRQKDGGRIYGFPNSDTIRTFDGFSDWVHRIKSLGNAVIPQIPEWIGRRIIECQSEKGHERG